MFINTFTLVLLLPLITEATLYLYEEEVCESYTHYKQKTTHNLLLFGESESVISSLQASLIIIFDHDHTTRAMTTSCHFLSSLGGSRNSCFFD